jgi:RNA polymerase sigma factor (sigma-70 family)
VLPQGEGASFLAGDPAAVDEVTGWIRRAAAPYRRRLAFEWEDLLQETLARLTADLRAGRYRGEGPLRAYVWRAVNHACLDRLRRHRRWQMTPADELELAASNPSPQTLTVERDTSRRVLALLATLPAPCRELWAMILDGQSYREMSARLGVAEGTLRVRVLRCRKQAVTRWREVTSAHAARRKDEGEEVVEGEEIAEAPHE